MPPKPAVDYRAGSEYHAQRRHLHTAAVLCCQSAIDVLGQPSSLLDVGCSEGRLVEWARERGIQAIGVDMAAPVHDSRGWLYFHDLRQELFMAMDYDWVLCWEVAEHLDSEYADILCDSLVRHLKRPSGRLIFTAAVPGQRGPGHINTQPLWFWRALLEDRGLVWLQDASEQLSRAWLDVAPRAPWYGKNVQVLAWA